MTVRATIMGIALLTIPVLATAQSSAVKKAAATITAADVRQRISVIADDSMLGRNTPSAGLTKTARYIADQFKTFGLKPGGDGGTWFQNYPIEQRRILPERSTLSVGLVGAEPELRLTFARDVAWSGRGLRIGSLKGALVLVGGAGRLDSIPAADLQDRIVVFVEDWNEPGAETRAMQLSRWASRAKARAMITVVNSDSIFSERYAGASAPVLTSGDVEGGFFNVAVRESAILAQVPGAAETFTALRQAPTVAVQAMLDREGLIAIRDTIVGTLSAPNTVGILEGSDPVLRDEYLVFSAHMDHVGAAGQPGAGCRARGADSICNGADDDASGTVGVVELAQAFSRKGARPKRSVIFLTVSGEEHGLWGSDWFTRHPPVPIRQIVANLNADMVGRNWADTIVAIGRQHSDLGSTLNRVNTVHPELNMHAIDDRWPEQRFYERSDHFNFAKRGVPILFFFNGTHVDYHRPSDSPEKIDTEKESRIIKLFFFVGQEVANAAQRPRWVPESYRQIVTPLP